MSLKNLKFLLCKNDEQNVKSHVYQVEKIDLFLNV